MDDLQADTGNQQGDEQRLEEVAAAAEDMEQLWAAESEGYRGFRRGDVVDGVVVRVDRDGIWVHIGAKSEGLIPLHEMQGVADNPPQEGEDVLVYVLQPEDHEGRVILSLDRARAEHGWRLLQRYFDQSEMFEAEVVDHNKGGLIVNVSGVRGFVPSSQIASLRFNMNSEQPLEERLSVMRGQVLKLKVVEINRRRNRLILSEKLAMQEWRSQMKEKLLQELQAGETRTGRVTSVANFGAFVDLGGIDGLVHLSELSWERVKHPKDVVKVGDEVTVVVLSVDQETQRVALSLRRARPEPWSLAVDKYYVGQLVTGAITKLTPFGAFARVEEGIEGLVHISELDERRIGHPKEVIKEGDILTLRVVRFEPERRRLGLSLKQAHQPVDERGRAETSTDSRTDGIVYVSETPEPDEPVRVYVSKSPGMSEATSDSADVEPPEESREEAEPLSENEQTSVQAGSQQLSDLAPASEPEDSSDKSTS